MMKKFKQIAAAIAATSIVGVAVLAHAGESKDSESPGFHQHFTTDDGIGDGHSKRGHGGNGHGGRGPASFNKVVNLTDAQKQTLKAARDARAPAMRESHENLRAAHEALKNAGDQNADDATLNKLAGELANIIAQQEVNRIKIHREFVSVLTPEQQQKLAAYEAEHKGPARWKDRQKNATGKNLSNDS